MVAVTTPNKRLPIVYITYIVKYSIDSEFHNTQLAQLCLWFRISILQICNFRKPYLLKILSLFLHTYNLWYQPGLIYHISPVKHVEY
ncbi:hypothetical protein KSF78_0008094 [Schistosoma japonicum]|nr:hypothetical protein KSF78_0008094 [Schistosoma japonicum]KAH8873611.1 hypothetical protein KSF78_0008094 [Schistosoma japonicum]KAH8873612.1 hypothetical protein KSF78_0008094 [Schistosoma japonicum]